MTRHTMPVALAVVVVAVALLACSCGATAEPLVTNVFEDEDIRNVLRYVSAQTGCNILAEQSVQGWVSLVVRDVPLDKALDMITEPLGYAWVKRDGYYIVGTASVKNPAYAAFVEAEVVKLGYVKADAAVKLLSDFFAPNVKANTASNSVVITGTRSVIDQVRQMLIAIDAAPARVAVHVAVIELAADEEGLDAGVVAPDMFARLVASGAARVRTAAQLSTVDGEAGEVSVTWEAGQSSATASFQVTPRLTREGEIVLKVVADVYESVRDGGAAAPSVSRYRASATVAAFDGHAVLVGKFSLHGAGASAGAGAAPDTLLIVVPRVVQAAG